MKELYPPIEPYNQGKLKVSQLHAIHYEESGNPQGKPVIFLHGGPGGGITPMYRQYFDPKKWRIVIFDQRGCGQSTPYAELTENTTWDLVADIEKLRTHLKIDIKKVRLLFIPMPGKNILNQFLQKKDRIYYRLTIKD